MAKTTCPGRQTAEYARRLQGYQGGMPVEHCSGCPDAHADELTRWYELQDHCGRCYCTLGMHADEGCEGVHGSCPCPGYVRCLIKEKG